MHVFSDKIITQVTDVIFLQQNHGVVLNSIISHMLVLLLKFGWLQIHSLTVISFLTVSIDYCLKVLSMTSKFFLFVMITDIIVHSLTN